MDRTDFNVRAEKKRNFFSAPMTNRGSLWHHNKGRGKTHALIREEIRT